MLRAQLKAQCRCVCTLAPPDGKCLRFTVYDVYEIWGMFRGCCGVVSGMFPPPLPPLPLRLLISSSRGVVRPGQRRRLAGHRGWPLSPARRRRCIVVVVACICIFVFVYVICICICIPGHRDAGGGGLHALRGLIEARRGWQCGRPRRRPRQRSRPRRRRPRPRKTIDITVN